MGYRKFSERLQGGHETLGGLAALGGQHPQIPGREIRTPTPPKVAKAPKVLPSVPVEGLEKSTRTPPKAPKVSAFPFAGVLNALEARCPDYVEPERWQQCIEDAQRFLAEWGPQAEALGWTSAELFGLHKPPRKPHPSYHRLSRYDATGLIWRLTRSRVVALTDDVVAIENRSTGNVTVYRKARKPALGPLGDSLDDFIP